MIEHFPIILIILPLFTAFAMPLLWLIFRKRGGARACEVVAISVMVVVLVLAFAVAVNVWQNGMTVYKLGGWSPPWGIVLAVDALSVQMAIMIAGLGLLVFIYASGYMGEEHRKDLFYTLCLLAIAGMMGVVLTGDMFNFFVFLEIMSISSYALISFRRDAGGIEGALKYMFMGSLGNSMILISIVLLYGSVGSLNIADLGAKLSAHAAAGQPVPVSLVLALSLFITGIMVKVAMIPFHTWLADSFTSAPTAISALLAGPAAVVGIYWVARLPYLPFGLPVGIILISLGLISMVGGVLMALVQRDFKRMLAYHVISQKGYMVLGIGLGTLGSVLGAQGGLFHLLNHSTYKAMLFMCAGAVLMRTGTQKFDELGGLGKKMPITAMAFLIGALAISGIPPMNGFASKYSIYLGGIEAGQPAITAIAVLVSALTFASFFKAFSSVFLGTLPKRYERVEEAPRRMLVAMVTMAAICVVIGLIPAIGFNVVAPAQAAAENSVGYIRTVLGGS
ncbi:MAG: proton-conducting transporter membrane subunit [Candidatus Hadarchaeales archaeon]